MRRKPRGIQQAVGETRVMHNFLAVGSFVAAFCRRRGGGSGLLGVGHQGRRQVHAQLSYEIGAAISTGKQELGSALKRVAMKL